MDRNNLQRERDLCEHAIDQWILGRNGERDRLILRMYLFDGITYSRMLDRLGEIARRTNDPTYEIGEDQLKKVIRKRKAELFKHI